MISNREAIKIAKSYIAENFSEEHLVEIGLEEIQRSNGDIWEITVGFRRIWKKSQHHSKTDTRAVIKDSIDLFASRYAEAEPREYKIVVIDGDNGEVIAMKNFSSLAA